MLERIAGVDIVGMNGIAVDACMLKVWIWNIRIINGHCIKLIITIIKQ
jgi:hypothetical protein